MPHISTQSIALIGDLVDSKSIQDRFSFQERLTETLKSVGEHSTASPYTLTLGDEFQALYTDAADIFADILEIRAAIYPVRCRFSMAIGEITTPINRAQAIGMDGPAFHHARHMIEELRKSGDQLSIIGLPLAIEGLFAPAINLLWASTESWNANRLRILCRELQNPDASMERYRLAVSERAIYKNIREARLHDWVQLIRATELHLNRLLKSWKSTKPLRSM